MGKKAKKECDLKSCVLCKQCLDNWLFAVSANRQCMHFKKRELLFEEGQEVKGMYFI